MKELRVVIQSESKYGFQDALKGLMKRLKDGQGSIPKLIITSEHKIRFVVIEDAEVLPEDLNELEVTNETNGKETTKDIQESPADGDVAQCGKEEENSPNASSE